MITFRYHIVSIVAVFLALSVGVLFGATFIDQSIVDGLEATQERLGDRNEQLRDRIVDLEGQNDQFRAFAGATRNVTVRGVLQDQPVVTIQLEGTPGDTAESIASTLESAGARQLGVLTLTDQLDLTSEETRARLAEAMEISSEDPQALSFELVRQLAEALAGENPQILPVLAEAGLVRGEIDSVAPGTEEAPVVGPPAVVILGGETSRTFSSRIVTPLVRALSERNLVSAVGVPGDAGVVLDTLRRDSDLRVTTVDGVESAMGQSALALGLRAALEGQFGMYGTGEGATTSVPIPEP